VICVGLEAQCGQLLSWIWVIEMIRARQHAKKDSLVSRLTAPEGLDIT